MSRLIATIEGCDITEEVDGRVHFVAKLAIDDDGSDNRQHDPCWQPDTTEHVNGHAIDSESVPGIVVPPAIRNGVRGIVMGCKARVTFKGKWVWCVVFDVGPRAKLGEGTPELARRLGINPSAINGGEDAHDVLFELWPDCPAIVDGITYRLQHS